MAAFDGISAARLQCLSGKRPDMAAEAARYGQTFVHWLNGWWSQTSQAGTADAWLTAQGCPAAAGVVGGLLSNPWVVGGWVALLLVVMFKGAR